jgi:hypothetical protein
MHGIMRTRNLKNNDTSAIDFVRRITIRYADGRTLRFGPDGGSENFTEDDAKQLVQILMKASATAEWSAINTRLGF